MSAKYDEILKEVSNHNTQIKNISSRVTKLEEAKVDTEIQRVSAAINDLEFQTRKLNIEIHGLKRQKDECLMTEMNKIASKLELPPLTETVVSALHRLPSRADKIPAIIVRFTRLETKEQWISKRGILHTVQSDLYMTENLTPQNRVLLRATKTWADENPYRFAWHRNGKILVRKCEGERAQVIKSVTDLERLVK
ncbi:hypothetical protein HPB49_009269 [Dermacentor silvarum]|uniref:Uncharacterized protein n=1 Tax=Dermacentor silvarum TaxID=543639 RepID=A0ACB8C8R3_DERSI|nr:hypothetical protein HPB49_009269 [Dermacentor silvarum]